MTIASDAENDRFAGGAEEAAAIERAIQDQDAEQTKTAVEEEGRSCIMMSGDVADPNFCLEAVSRTTKQLGHLDVLVNNAAFQEHVNDIEELTETHFDRTLKTNLYGYFQMAKAAGFSSCLIGEPFRPSRTWWQIRSTW